MPGSQILTAAKMAPRRRSWNDWTQINWSLRILPPSYRSYVFDHGLPAMPVFLDGGSKEDLLLKFEFWTRFL